MNKDKTYREFLVKVTQDIVNLRNESDKIRKTDTRKNLLLQVEILNLINIQDKLITYLSSIEGVSVSELRDEFDFTY